MRSTPSSSSPFAPRHRGTLVLVPVLLVGVLVASAAHASFLPPGFSETRIAYGLTRPTSMALAPDGRLFVAEQRGTLRVIKNGVLLPAPALTVPTPSSGARGLLGVAVDPDFASNGWIYVHFSATSPALHNRVSRFTLQGDVAVAGSEQVIFDLDNLTGDTDHNGGALHFGPDGKLYLTTGDDGHPPNSQSLGNVLGKLLRINRDGSIPGDNPLLAGTTGKNRAIWALGFRNPYTFAFQPGTGRMLINDVGLDTWEEINEGFPGANYGWPTTEGPTNNPAFRSPVFAYGHGTGPTTGCAITGGTFYNPAVLQFPAEYAGAYFYADLCSNWIRRFDPVSRTSAAFATGTDSPLDLVVAPDGSLYYLSFESGAVFRIDFPGGAAVPCTPSTTTLCLNNGRFAVEARWRTGDGQIGVGRGVQLTADTGYFWFFADTNVEMVVKVLDACSFNSRYWVFAGGLTDVEVFWTVTDTVTGNGRIYRNPPGTPLLPVQDTNAFATCGTAGGV